MLLSNLRLLIYSFLNFASFLAWSWVLSVDFLQKKKKLLLWFSFNQDLSTVHIQSKIHFILWGMVRTGMLPGIAIYLTSSNMLICYFWDLWSGFHCKCKEVLIESHTEGATELKLVLVGYNSCHGGICLAWLWFWGDNNKKIFWSIIQV